jgi:pheromone shutdown protein TraB
MQLTVISGTVGGEFKAAIEEAQAVQARIVFGDQPVEITSSRMASRVGFRVRLPFKTPSPDSELTV